VCSINQVLSCIVLQMIVAKLALMRRTPLLAVCLALALACGIFVHAHATASSRIGTTARHAHAANAAESKATLQAEFASQHRAVRNDGQDEDDLTGRSTFSDGTPKRFPSKAEIDASPELQKLYTGNNKIKVHIVPHTHDDVGT
jgi:hypothetical protein